MNKIKIYYIDINFVKDHLDEIVSFVSESRRIKANKYKQEDDKYRSLGAGYLLKKYLPPPNSKYFLTHYESGFLIPSVKKWITIMNLFLFFYFLREEFFSTSLRE